VIIIYVIAKIAESGDHVSTTSVTTTTPSTSQRQPQLTVSALRLFDDYQANEVAADQVYRGRWLRITGVVDAINKDFLDKTYLTLQTSNMFMSVHATLMGTEGGAASLRRGQQVALICKGQGMTMGSPMLDDCTFDTTPPPRRGLPTKRPKSPSAPK
jgi:hypothetical protein